MCIQIGKADLNGHDYVKRVYSPEGKSPNLCTGTGGNHEPKISEDNITWRKLTPRECARLQTIPEDLIEKMLNCGVSNSQLYKMLGNGWTIEVIKHILSHIPNYTAHDFEVLSMYDGMACAYITLKEMGVNISKY